MKKEIAPDFTGVTYREEIIGIPLHVVHLPHNTIKSFSGIVSALAAANSLNVFLVNQFPAWVKLAAPYSTALIAYLAAELAIIIAMDARSKCGVDLYSPVLPIVSAVPLWGPVPAC
ncbi:hypothetical protein [Xenorhabdus indica]|uniref:hypothetical protein n=1 Tax=Xenorhabdus indica TaxID=333964 RepID=UPI0016575E57|nr:hypothetical protein [Xenorhabdus indica]MBC8945108.1 hypothetical protein [Xenorhabdus indica]